jgi:cell division septal protein FtsQ
MRCGGSGWKPASRRNRRRDRAPKRSTEEGADRSFVILLAIFAALVLGLVLFWGFTFT